MIEPTAKASSPRMSRPVLAAILVVGTSVIVALVVFAIGRMTGEGTSRVPDGWKPIVVGSVQFAVPDSWPVHEEDSGCFDQATNGVTLLKAEPGADSGGCPATNGKLIVGAYPHHLSPDGILGAVDNPRAGPHVTLEDLNGLRAVLDYREDDTGYSYAYFLVDEPIVIGLIFGDHADTDLAHKIIDTIGLAPGAAPPTTAAPTTTVDPAGAAAAQWDDVLRSAVQRDPSGAEDTAQHLMTSLDPGSCVPAGSVDLGPLAGDAHWIQICRYGRSGEEPSGLNITMEGDPAPTVTYSASPPISPSVCYRKVTGNWWLWYPPNHQNPADPCVVDYTFQGA